jgi:uncharacterized protein YcfJ
MAATKEYNEDRATRQELISIGEKRGKETGKIIGKLVGEMIGERKGKKMGKKIGELEGKVKILEDLYYEGLISETTFREWHKDKKQDLTNFLKEHEQED